MVGGLGSAGFGAALAPERTPWYHLALAVVLILVCLFPVAHWLARGERRFPALPILCLSYALQFAVPVFTTEPTLDVVDGRLLIRDPDVTAVLLLSIAGVVALQAGYASCAFVLLQNRVRAVSLGLDHERARVYCFVVWVGAALTSSVFGDAFAGNATLDLLVRTQTAVAIGISAWLAFSGSGSWTWTVITYTVVVATAVRGLSGGMLEAVLTPVGILVCMRWLYTRRVPVGLLVAVLAIILFFSPVKASVRNQFGTGTWLADGRDASRISAMVFFVEQAFDYWERTLLEGQDLTRSTEVAARRTDMIHQFGHVWSLTPEPVPYQNGDTYKFLATSFVPRVLWPDKPLVGGANNYYAIAYRISSVEGVERSTFGVGLMPESFINFGILGVLVIMAIQGAILSAFQTVVTGPGGGAGGMAIFVACYIPLVYGVGSSAEVVYGGLIQNLVAGYLLLWWVKTGREDV